MYSSESLSIDTERIAEAVNRIVSYRFKVWGFGEEIGLHSLLDYSAVTGNEAPAEFVERLVRPWCEQAAHLTLADHVAPGAVIVELFEKTGDEVYLAAAKRLGQLYLSFTEVDGIPLHRPDLQGLDTLIWVDCLALDGPFLVRLARLLGDDSWLALGDRTLRSYCQALFDAEAGLFRHGYDVELRRQSDCNWGRGNGWAMHGLVDTLAGLPAASPLEGELRSLLARQVEAVIALQDESGLWHTVLDDRATPLENSTAALFASALLKASRLDLLPGRLAKKLPGVLTRSFAALNGHLERDGGLPVSYATRVGQRHTYVQAPLGVFPWGQGPLVLSFTESRRLNDEGRFEHEKRESATNKVAQTRGRTT